jgi:hypothetical protein
MPLPPAVLGVSSLPVEQVEIVADEFLALLDSLGLDDRGGSLPLELQAYEFGSSAGRLDPLLIREGSGRRSSARRTLFPSSYLRVGGEWSGGRTFGRTYVRTFVGICVVRLTGFTLRRPRPGLAEPAVRQTQAVGLSLVKS